MYACALLDSAEAETDATKYRLLLSSDARQEMTYMNSELPTRQFLTRTGIIW